MKSDSVDTKRSASRSNTLRERCWPNQNAVEPRFALSTEQLHDCLSSLEQEYELNKLVKNLNLVRIEQYVRSVHRYDVYLADYGLVRHLADTTRQVMAGWDWLVGSDDRYTHHYWVLAAKAATMLHESIHYGHSAEEVVDLADEIVGGIVCDLTMDRRHLSRARAHLSALRLHKAAPIAKFIKACDLMTDLEMLRRMLGDYRKYRRYGFQIYDKYREVAEILPVVVGYFLSHAFDCHPELAASMRSIQRQFDELTALARTYLPVPINPVGQMPT